MAQESRAAAPRAAIRAAVEKLNLEDFPAWSDLDQLSRQTTIDMLEIFEEETIWDGSKFSLPVNIYVTLNYSDDEMTDVFPGSVYGRMDKGRPVIENFEVDVSSFYYSHGIENQDDPHP